jgi:hypothetical protein
LGGAAVALFVVPGVAAAARAPLVGAGSSSSAGKAPRQVVHTVFLPALYQGQRLAFQVTGQLGGGPVTAAMLYDQRWAVAVAGPRLSVLDLAAAGQPQVLGTTLPLTGTTVSLAVSGRRAYASAVLDDSSAELRVLDINTPTRPMLLGRLTLARDDDAPGTVVALGERAFVLDGGGLSVIDAREPARPRLVEHVATRGRPVSMALAGSRLYVTEADDADAGGLEVLDLAAGTPRSVGYLALETAGTDVLLRGNVAFLAGGEGSPVLAVDIARPELPVRLGAVNAAGILRLFPGNGSWLYGEAKVDDSDEEPYQLRTFQAPIDTPTTWSLAGSTGLPVGARMLAGSAGQLLQGDAAGRLTLLDGAAGLPTPAGKVALCSFVLGWPGALVADGRFVYVVDRQSHSLEVLAASVPERAERLGSLPLPADLDVADMVLAHSVLYLVAPDLGLLAVDVHDPTAPRIVGQWPAWAGDVLAVSGSLLVLGRRAGVADGALQILNIADPVAPIARGQLGLDVADLSISASVAFVSGACAGPDEGFPCLSAISLGNPDQPRLLSAIKAQVTRGDPGAVATDGAFAYDSRDSSAALSIFDVSHPSQMNAAGLFADNEAPDGPVGGLHRLALGSERLFFTDALGLRVIDARRHAAPALERRFAFPPAGGLDLAMVAGRAYVSADDGVWVVERAPDPLSGP